MDRKQLTNGLSEIGLGVILFVTALELPLVLSYDTITELFIFFLKFLSYISIVIGIITTIMAVIPEVKKPDNKEGWIEKKK
jgi:hypothetical protein